VAFARPWWLLLVALLPYFIHLGRPVGRHGRRRAWAALGVRCALVTLVVLSLAGAQAVLGSDRLAVVYLLDVSDSISEVERRRALTFVSAGLAALGPRDRAGLVLFGADAVVERPVVDAAALGPIASVARTHHTDLAEAVRLGVGLLPAGAARRLVILSDGRATVGDAEQAVRLARSQGVQVDVVPLDATLPVEVWLEALELPDRLHQGEEFSLLVAGRATTETTALLTVEAGARVVAQETLRLSPGENTFAVPLKAEAVGFLPFRASLAPAADTYPQNNALSAFVVVEGPPRVLLVASEGVEDDALATALRATGFDVQARTPGAMPSDPASLAAYGAVVLVDTPAAALSPRAMDALQAYVRDLGGGLVAVGGPNAYGVGGWYDTPLEETLPVEMTIHDQERFPPMAIVIVIDKSGSMAATEGGVQKIRLAGEAAARVAELITDLDEITVIAFDDRPVDVIGPTLGSQREAVIERVTRLQAGGGGIYVRESLEAALEYLAESEQQLRHVILLADGSDAEHQQGVPTLVEERMAAQGVTLSTVAIGGGQDLRFLEQVATLGGGRYHFTDRAANLPVIFAQETQLAMRSYVVEEPFHPRQTARSPILAAIDEVPSLVGYVATTPKPAGRVILSTHQEDPLLAAWQYGLGRAVAWTSDATGRWAQSWVAWEEFARFWAQTVRWSIVERMDRPAELTVTPEGERAWATLDVVGEEGAPVNGLDAQLSVVGPAGETHQLTLAQEAPGRYAGHFPAAAEGAYLMRVSGSLMEEPLLAFTTGWVRGYSPEYGALQGDPTYLTRLAELGGGRMLEEAAQSARHDVAGRGVRRELWPYLLAMAALLVPVDVGVRRLAVSRRDWVRAWAWLRGRLRPPGRPAPEEHPPALERLFRAKARVEERGPEPRGPVASPPTVEGPTPREPGGAPEAPATPPAADASETLAGRLLRRKQTREGDER
jgi:uncharacterized membrane protein